jgi:glycosyltransferase involved in cell wall biosynthesis
VYDTPLTYMTEQDKLETFEIEKLRNFQEKVKLQYGKKRYIGVFGFISSHKGFSTAIESLKWLPDEYELLIFGGTHPASLWDGMDKHPAIEPLKQLIEEDYAKFERRGKKLSLSERVHFFGAMSDEEMLIGMAICDSVLFPYHNVRQTASAPTALATELDRHIVASRNNTFLEFLSYFPEALELFDIGNDIELAQRVMRNRTKVNREEEKAGVRLIIYNERAKPYSAHTTRALYKEVIDGAR